MGMAEHQRQWQSVMTMSDSHSQQNLAPNSNTMSMPSAQFQSGSSSNLTTVSAPTPNTEQFSAWQRQYQSQSNAYHSAMNIQQQQQHYAMQQQQQLAQQQMQMRLSQQRLFQEQAQQQRNLAQFGSARSMPSTNSNHSFRMQPTEPAITEETTDHSGFVPPPPQANKEIEKFVKWQAKRKGIEEQQAIEMEVA